MKKQFSTHWKASRRKSKQRKYLLNSSYTVKHKLMSANLSKELRKKYGKRSFPARKGDEVLIMRGKFKGKKGKISKINTLKMKASIEGIQVARKDGTKVNLYFYPSKLQITALSLDDKKRIKAIERNTNNKVEKKIKTIENKNK